MAPLPTRIRIAARRSDLARYQAYRVGEALRATRPGLEVEYSFRESLGDKNLHDPLWKMPERGVFTEDFLRDLEEGDCDLVVHSWKDLPVEERETTEILGTLLRADVRDLLLLKPDAPLAELRIFTSSPRRIHHLASALPQLLPPAWRKPLAFDSVRGNIPTRIEKFLDSSEHTGLVLAKAALDRLLTAPEAEFRELQTKLLVWLRPLRFVVLPVSLDPPAAAQGALAIEAKRGREDLRGLIALIHHEATAQAVREERRILASYGGGCHQKIGVHIEWVRGEKLTTLSGRTDDGRDLGSRQLQSARAPKGKVSPDEIFPRPDEKSALRFSRESLAIATPTQANAFYVSKFEAWSSLSAPTPATSVVWSAGLETWRKLASAGVFVSGSDEGLGERLPLLPWRTDLAWRKLSHAEAPSDERLPLLATYRLRAPTTRLSDLSPRRYFYWSSASQFEWARGQFPQILHSGLHACGPGHTADALLAAGLPTERLWLCLDYESWLGQLGLPRSPS